MAFLFLVRRWRLALVASLLWAVVGLAQEVPSPPLLTGEVSTPRFRIRYTKRSERAAAKLAGTIEASRDRFGDVLGRDWPGVTEIRLGLGRTEFEALALPGGAPPSWAAAIAYPERNIVLLEAFSLNGPRGEMTLRHELTHVALGRLGAVWPHWFQEGLAMYLTGDRFSLTQYSALFRGVTQDRIFSFDDLVKGWPEQSSDVEIAYAQSLSFVEFLVSRHGPARMGELIDGVRAGESWEASVARAFDSSIGHEERLWRDELPARYSWLPVLSFGTTLWAAVALLCVTAWMRRRKQHAARLAEMSAEEEAEALAQHAQAASVGAGANDLLPVEDNSLAMDGPERNQLDLWPDDQMFEETERAKRIVH